MEEKRIKEIAKLTAKKFRSFGGERMADDDNPIAAAMKDKPAQFAMGVNIEEVVRFVLSMA